MHAELARGPLSGTEKVKARVRRITSPTYELFSPYHDGLWVRLHYAREEIIGFKVSSDHWLTFTRSSSRNCVQIVHRQSVMGGAATTAATES